MSFNYRFISVVALVNLLNYSVINAQITITQDDMPQAGDTLRVSEAVDFAGIDYVSTGAGFSWDFTSLGPYNQRVDTFVSVSETPLAYQLMFFLNSNLAKKEGAMDQIPGFQVTDYYTFYKNSSSEFKSTGFGITLNGIPIPNVYNEPDIIYHFPLSYGSADSSDAIYELAIPGLGYMGGWKHRVNHVDGWGDVSTPFGQFEAIRVRTDIEQYDSIYIDSLGFGFPIYRNVTEYKWLTNGVGFPIMKVTDDGILPMFEYADSVRTIPFLGVEDNFQMPDEMAIFPNPATEVINVKIPEGFEGPGTIELHNLSGIRIGTYELYFHSGFAQYKLVEPSLRNKFLIVRVCAGGKIYSGRILVK